MYPVDENNPYEQSQLFYQPNTEQYQQPTYYQQPVSAPTPQRPATPPARRMSKAEALSVVDTCKAWLIAGSIVSFGVLSALVASHVLGTTANANTDQTTQ